MNSFDEKVLENFPGKVVRKDLTALMKKGANVPTYVLEYLLGMYCATDDDEAIDTGIKKIKRILSENYVRPDQSEYVKSKIKENGQYTIIDKVTVFFDEREEKYVARFTNLRVDPFEVPSDLVIHNEKLLIGGIWCIVNIEYVGLDNGAEEDGQIDFELDIFGDQKRKKNRKKRSKYDSPFEISSLKPIQMPNLDLDEIKEARRNFTEDEWITLLLRSAGYEPDELTQKEKLHYLLRFVPFIQKNYNLVELGPRGTGKSHVYAELSPYSILMSSGTTTVSNMFYNMSSRRVGLVGNWDCVAFDEVAGITQASGDMIQIMKNYMANGSFARGADAVSSDASIAYFNDLQNRGVSDEISVAEVVGLFSGLANRAVLPSLVICGRVVMSGSMMPITTELDEIFMTAANAGAKTIMLPKDTKRKYEKLKNDLKNEMTVIFYSNPLDASKKALGIDL